MLVKLNSNGFQFQLMAMSEFIIRMQNANTHISYTCILEKMMIAQVALRPKYEMIVCCCAHSRCPHRSMDVIWSATRRQTKMQCWLCTISRKEMQRKRILIEETQKANNEIGAHFEINWMENADTQKTKQRKKNTTQCNVASHYMSAMVLDKCARTSSNANIYTRPPNGHRDDSGRTHDFYVYECRVCVCMCGVHGHSILLLLSGKRITVCVCVQCAPSYVQLQWHKNKNPISRNQAGGALFDNKMIRTLAIAFYSAIFSFGIRHFCCRCCWIPQSWFLLSYEFIRKQFEVF